MSDNMDHGARVGDPAFFAAVRGRAAEIATDLRKEVTFPSKGGYDHLVQKVIDLKVEIKEIKSSSSKDCSTEYPLSLSCEILRMIEGRILILNGMLGYNKALNVYSIELIGGMRDVRAYDDEEVQEDAVRYVACVQALLEAAKAKKSPVLDQLFEAA